MSADGVTDKQWMELLAKVDKLVEGVNSLQRDLKDWKDELIEEFSELTGLLVEHYQQVIDKHLLNKEVVDYYDGQTIDSPESGEDSDSDSTFVDEEGDNHSNHNNSKQSDESMASDGHKHMSKDQTNQLESEVD